jgi:hypothetical protein
MKLPSVPVDIAAEKAREPNAVEQDADFMSLREQRAGASPPPSPPQGKKLAPTNSG